MWSAQKSFAVFYNVFHTCSVLFVLSDYRKCMEELRFSKMQPRTAVHSRFSV